MNFSKSKLDRIAEKWNLGPIVHNRKLYGGFQTPKVLVETTKGRYVVSRHNLSTNKTLISKSPSSFLFEIDLLNSLNALPIPRFLTSKSGRYLEKVDNDWITVDEFVGGKPPRKFNARMADQLGQFLGNFHSQGQSFKKILPGRRRFYDLDPLTMQKMHPIAKRQTNAALKAVVEEIRIGVENSRPPRNLPKGSIHVDIKPDNELWEGKKLAAVLDFGNFYVDTFMIDIGKTIMWNFRKGSRIDSDLEKAFLHGYELKRRLSKAERTYLKSSILYAIYSHIWVDLYHVPLGYVPESYTLSLVRDFLPIARSVEGGI